MAGIELTDLGLTTEQLRDLVVDRLIKQFTSQLVIDEDEDGSTYEGWTDTQFGKDIRKAVMTGVEAKVTEIANEHIIPSVAEYIEEITLQQTNAWGQAKGEPMTFIEYLVARAHAFMTEKVDCTGKTKVEAGTYGWNGTQTRLTYMIDRHLQYSIATAMGNALQSANATLTESIAESCRMKLKEVAETLTVTAKLKT